MSIKHKLPSRNAVPRFIQQSNESKNLNGILKARTFMKVRNLSKERKSRTNRMERPEKSKPSSNHTHFLPIIESSNERNL